jgi:hypothetical protein
MRSYVTARVCLRYIEPISGEMGDRGGIGVVHGGLRVKICIWDDKVGWDRMIGIVGFGGLYRLGRSWFGLRWNNLLL